MERLGNYQILRKLGAGAMGEVYLAEHVLLRVKRALKVLPDSLAGSKEFRERFLNEGQLLASLQHPGIVQVYDMGIENDAYYIAMDFVSPDGRQSQSLDDLLAQRGGRLPPDEVAGLLTQICEALAYAHGKGVIHRDIKPSNILAAGDGRVKVSDFGLAKIAGGDFLQRSIAASLSGSLGAARSLAPSAAADASLGAEASLGRKGSSTAESLVGTFHYMPPEVQDGGEWTQQGDIYSLGVLVYVLLVGQRPVGRWRAPSAVVTSTPTYWDAVVERALEANPEHRYSSVEECSNAIRLLTGRSAKAGASRFRTATRTDVPESVIELAREFVEEHQAQWDHSQFMEFLVRVYQEPAHAGLAKESIGGALESEKKYWLEEESRRKAEQARLAADRRKAAEEAERLHREAEEARRKAETAQQAEILKVQARAAFEDGEFGNARRLYEQVLAKCPDDTQASKALTDATEREAELLGRNGQEAFDAQHFMAAAAHWKKALELAPGNAELERRIREADTIDKKLDALVKEARSLIRRSKDKAYLCCDEISHISPKHSAIQEIRREADLHFQSCMKLKQQAVEAMKRKSYEEALNYWTEALAHQRSDSDCNANIPKCKEKIRLLQEKASARARVLHKTSLITMKAAGCSIPVIVFCYVEYLCCYNFFYILEDYLDFGNGIFEILASLVVGLIWIAVGWWLPALVAGGLAAVVVGGMVDSMKEK